MNKIDAYEKAGRLVLWLSIASCFVLASLTYVSFVSAANE